MDRLQNIDPLLLGDLSWKTTQNMVTIDLFVIESSENRLELLHFLTDSFVWVIICQWSQ